MYELVPSQSKETAGVCIPGENTEGQPARGHGNAMPPRGARRFRSRRAGGAAPYRSAKRSTISTMRSRRFATAAFGRLVPRSKISEKV